VPFDSVAYQQEIGVDELVSEPGYTPLEHLWARPTLEINGLWGGFQGEGIKTVLPNAAHAKITCRLVANQDPTVIRDRLTAHLLRQRLPGVRVTVQPLGIGARPYLMPTDHWGNQAAAAVLADLYGRPPFFTRSGGSVPVLDLFLNHLGAYAVSFGFSLRDEQIHAPNEFCRLSTFRRGPVAYTRLLRQLAQTAH
jgi:acetylornithine deacetylase/succinyl-diaminopimelate desuccinylase-like protein